MSEINIKDMTIEQLKDVKKQAQEAIERMERKPLAWKPKVGEKYWYPVADGTKSGPRWADDLFDNRLYNQGNCMSEDLATYTIKTRSILHQIHEWIDENDAERGGRFIVGEDDNWFIVYESSCDKLRIDFMSYFVFSQLPFFSSAEKAQACIDEIGDDIKCLFTQYVEVSE